MAETLGWTINEFLSYEEYDRVIEQAKEERGRYEEDGKWWNARGPLKRKKRSSRVRGGLEVSKRRILGRTRRGMSSKRKMNRISFSRRSLNFAAFPLDYSRVGIMARDVNMDHGSNVATRRFVTDGSLLVARLRHRSPRRG